MALLFVAVLGVAVAGCGKSASAATPAVALKEDTVFEFVGRVDQNDLSVKSYGYLTHVSGLNDADLFSVAFPAWNEGTAKFTFVTNSTLNARFLIPGVFTVAGSGDTTYYFTSTPTGTFTDPATFATGTEIATTSGRYTDANTVIAPGQGVINGSGQVTQNSATSVTVGSSPFTLGAAGLLVRISYSGLATRTDPTANTSFTYLSGRATTIR